MKKNNNATTMTARASLIQSVVAFMRTYNYPATYEGVNRALGTAYLPAEAEKAGYGDGHDKGRQAERRLINDIIRKLNYYEGMVTTLRAMGG